MNSSDNNISDYFRRFSLASLLCGINGTFRIVQIASIEPRKGQDILLQSLQLLPKAVTQNIEFDLIGRLMYQTDEKYCHGIVKTSKKLGNVNLIGEIPAEEIRHYLESADVFVLPSRDEALPQSLVEAMAYGKAVIATRVGGIPKLFKMDIMVCL